MKRLLLSLLLLTSHAAFAKAPDVQLTTLKFSPPEPQRVVLSNGIVVYIQEDHELPLVSFSIDCRSTPLFEKKPGLLAIFGSVWRAGGTRTKTPDQLNDQLEYRAASIETSGTGEGLSVSASCLKKDLDQVLDLFTEVLLQPRFDESQLSLAKGKVVESIRRKNETPAQIARRAFRDVVYGPTHFYALDSKEKDINAISRSDLQALHRTAVVPDGAIMAVAGDINKDEIVQELEQRFQGWKKTGRTLPAYDYSPRLPPAGKVFIIDKEATQSRISIGRLGFDRLSSDEFAVRLTDYLFGGGGPSRLFNEIRSRQGLAYVVGSFYTAYSGAGMVGAACQTKAESTVDAVKAMKREFKKLAENPPGPRELKLAKDASINSFVFGFDSAYEIANTKANEEFYGYPDDHIRTYTQKLDAVSLGDIRNMIQKYYRVEDLKIVIVGSEKKFGDKVMELGDVVKIPLESVE